MGEGIAAQEPNQTVQFAYPVLERRPGKAPAILRFQLKGCFGRVRRTFFYVMSFIELGRDKSVRRIQASQHVHARQRAPIQQRGGVTFP
jgi:hypothetical protein